MSGPVRLWWWSRQAYLRRWTKVARLLQMLNALVYKADLPPDVDFQPDIKLLHRGTGVVIHPNVKIGKRVVILHGVTIAGTEPHNDGPMVIEDGVQIGTGAVILPRRTTSITVGEKARIGANAVVRFDVPPGATVRGPKSGIYPAPEAEQTSP
jgi:serine O-acetyltransferase